MLSSVRVRQYRELAGEARRAARLANSEDRASYFLMAEQFEFLAQAFEAQASDEEYLRATVTPSSDHQLANE